MIAMQGRAAQPPCATPLRAAAANRPAAAKTSSSRTRTCSKMVLNRSAPTLCASAYCLHTAEARDISSDAS